MSSQDRIPDTRLANLLACSSVADALFECRTLVCIHQNDLLPDIEDLRSELFILAREFLDRQLPMVFDNDGLQDLCTAMLSKHIVNIASRHQPSALRPGEFENFCGLPDAIPSSEHLLRLDMAVYHLDNALNTLPQRSLDVLRRLSGVPSGEPLTATETGLELGMTSLEVRIIEASAMKALRNAPRAAHVLRAYSIYRETDAYPVRRMLGHDIPDIPLRNRKQNTFSIGDGSNASEVIHQNSKMTIYSSPPDKLTHDCIYDEEWSAAVLAHLIDAGLFQETYPEEN